MNETPPAVRILPMTNDIPAEFPGCSNIDELQQIFFLNVLPSRKGIYYCRKSCLNAESGTVVLFQCKASIIASATLTGIEKFEVQDEGGHIGYLIFDVMSIKIFKPITDYTIRKIWPDFSRFNQTKQHLRPPENYSEFMKIVEYVVKPELPVPTDDACYLPLKKDFEAAYRALTRPGESISIDAVLDQIQTDVNKKGLTLESNWRVTTEKNIDLWSK